MSKKKPTVRKIAIDSNPKGNLKALGGGDHDDWNNWLASRTSGALPVNQKDEASVIQATVAIYSGMIDMKPADPIEAMLISQIIVANEAALKMYRRAWTCDPADYFEAHTKYLALADRSARTVATLIERLDRHRGQGQQQITVKHVTVNADQAVVTDQVVTGKPEGISSALLTAISEMPMQMIAETSNPKVGVGRKKE